MRGFLAVVVLLAAAVQAAIEPDVKDALVRNLRFSSSEIADLQKGKVVKHGVEASAPGELAVVGAVRVQAPVERLIESVRQITDFKRGPDVMQIGRFSDPPVLEDLAPLTITKEDFDASSCRVGDCSVRLPADAIRRLPAEVDSSGPDAQARAAAWFKQVIFDDVRAYWTKAPGRFEQYDDDSVPVRPIDDFNELVKSTPSVAALVPMLPKHLLEFPSERIEGSEDFLYWSKEKFGIAPFVTVTHVTIICRTTRSCIVATKDVYSSRYLDASLSLTIASGDTANQNAFYLIYLNRSRSSALKGFLSGLRKSIAERRARSSLDETLKSLKARLEKPAPKHEAAGLSPHFSWVDRPVAVNKY
ncbi:MAG TPA: hypothetical protein VH583_20900 [Vicinamibacterales bacterium]|jgi:hypothetical protein